MSLDVVCRDGNGLAVADRSILEEVAGYVDFDVDDANRLKALGPILCAYFEPIVDDFYATILKTEGAAAVLKGGEAQVHRLRSSLFAWLNELFVGQYDAHYLERRCRIGRVHVAIGLESRYMFAAMNRIRQGLHTAIERSGASQAGHAHRCIDKICDIELAIMLESYREHYVSQIRAAERLTTLGQIAGSIAHDLRNPLAVIDTSVHVLRRTLDADEEMDRLHVKWDRHLTRIREQTSVAADIVHGLLELAKDESSRREHIEIEALLAQVVSGIPDPKEQARVRLHLCGKRSHASLDRTQIRQLLVNLITNGLQASKGRVDVSVETDRAMLIFEVCDEGEGIPKELLSRIFEPLFTTKHRGLGLGLALCLRIAEAHQGWIHVDGGGASEGRGATFRVYLPDAVLQPGL